MKHLVFATGNEYKFNLSKSVAENFSVDLIQKDLKIDEIQNENSEPIIRNKLEQAYTILDQPVVVSDDTWSIPGLNGFPGPYMKSVLNWFEAENFIDLTKNLANRSFILTQYVAYYDGVNMQILTKEVEGTLLSEPKGLSGNSWNKVTSLSGGKSSIAEDFDNGMQTSLPFMSDVWKDFFDWFVSI